MKKLDSEKLQLYSAGADTVACFVAGALVVFAVANWWNPLGYVLSEGAMVIGLACVVGG